MRVAVGGLAVLGVLAGLGFAGGFTLGRNTARPEVPGEHSVDVGFLRDMVVHHAQAVTLARLALQRVQNRPLRNLADDVVMTQQREIGIMTGWLEQWGRAPSSLDPPMAWMSHGRTTLGGPRMPGMATPAEVAKFAVMRGPAADTEFGRLMLAHHLGGLHMVEEAIARAQRPEVIVLAQRMRADQQREVAILLRLARPISVSH